MRTTTYGFKKIVTFLVTSVLVFALFQDVSCADALEDTEGKKEDVQAMLHSLSLFVLASEILGYMRDGAGGISTLESKYSDHPGWIPAFGQAQYDEENDVLLVPLGECMWKVFTGHQGEIRFSLLLPQDNDLDLMDRSILMQHLFRLGNTAILSKNREQADRHFRVAESLLAPEMTNTAKVQRHPRKAQLKVEPAVGQEL